MKNYSVRLICILLVSVLLTGIFAGCGAKDAGGSRTEAGVTADGKIVAETETEAEDKAIDEIPLPITNEPVTLTYYTPLGSILARKVKSFAETPIYMELEKRTGIKVEFIHPAVGQETEQFNLLVASNELPDIIQANFVGAYNGGPEKAIADNIIIPLNELVEKYAPNLRKYLNDHKDLDKLVKTDSGKYYAFPSLRPDPSTLVYLGPIMRKDWLDQAGLGIPETIDEWYAALKSFKEKNGTQAPLTVMMDDLRWNSCLVGSFGIGRDFYLAENGTKVKFGPYEPEYKAFLETANKWFEEGLLDPDFATNDRKAFEAKITSEQAGAFYNYSSSITQFTNAVKPANPNFALVGVPYPVKKKGDMAAMGQFSSMVRTGNYAHITTANKHLKETAMWLDYAYSEEGNLLFNFGIENDSYTMVNDYPQYTDKIMKDPAGISEALAVYVFSGPFITDPRYFEQTLSDPSQKEANSIWAKTKARENIFPPLTPSTEDSGRLATIMGEVNTYCDEMFLKFIYGQEPIENFDQYIAQLKKMAVEEAIALQQEALDAFNKR